MHARARIFCGILYTRTRYLKVSSRVSFVFSRNPNSDSVARAFCQTENSFRIIFHVYAYTRVRGLKREEN